MGEGDLSFLNGLGGAGGTFHLNLPSAQIRKDEGVAVVSSGITSTLLNGG